MEAVDNLRNEDYLGLTHDILQIAKRYVPILKFADIAWDGYEFGKKFEKAYTAFTKIQKLGDDVALKFFNLIKSNYGSILDKIQWKNQQWGAIMPDVNPQDFWQKIQQSFPNGTLSPNPHHANQMDYVQGAISFSFYPDSNTTTAAGIPCYTLAINSNGTTIKIRFC